jgi:hypothetical protein
MTGKPWSVADENRLRDIYPVTSQKECARLMGRTPKSIASRAKLLKVRRIRNYKRWAAVDDARIRKEYPNTPTAELAKLLGATLLALHQRAQRLGVKKSAEYMASPAACRLRRGDEVGKAFRFQKGIVPNNKGLHRPGYSIGRGRMSETTFKKGERRGTAAQNWKPIGTICPDNRWLPAKESLRRHGRIWESKSVGVCPHPHVDRCQWPRSARTRHCFQGWQPSPRTNRKSGMHFARGPDAEEFDSRATLSGDQGSGFRADRGQVSNHEEGKEKWQKTE